MTVIDASRLATPRWAVVCLIAALCRYHRRGDLAAAYLTELEAMAVDPEWEWTA